MPELIRYARDSWDMFVGSYESAEGNGIHWVRINMTTGMLQRVASIGGVTAPSFIALDRAAGRLYAVSEQREGGVVAFEIDQSKGVLTEVDRTRSGGADPCYLSLSADGSWLFGVNYSSGSLFAFPIERDGKFGDRTLVEHQGHSVHPVRQEGPHPHSIVSVPGLNVLLVPDLGLDVVIGYTLDSSSGALVRCSEVSVPAGSGPRHLAFHQTLPVVYVLDELSSSIGVYSVHGSSGPLVCEQRLSTLPENYVDESAAADIHVHPTEPYLYASNRGDDSIAVFRIEDTGRLRSSCFVPTMGRTPRNFAITPDGRYLLIANQDSDKIVVFRIDPNGRPIPTGMTYHTPHPSCVCIW